MQRVPTLLVMIALAGFRLPCRAESQPVPSTASDRPVLSNAESDLGLEVWIHPSLVPTVRRKLETALLVATQRVRGEAACRRLFEELGADGPTTLESSLYFGADIRQEKRLCKGTVAFTTVGARPTYLCRAFSRLPANRAATALIHEALHQAGMSEWPLDPQAMEPAQIDRLVRRSCGL